MSDALRVGAIEPDLPEIALHRGRVAAERGKGVDELVADVGPKRLTGPWKVPVGTHLAWNR